MPPPRCAAVVPRRARRREHGVFSVSAQVLGVSSSLGVPVMGVWLSRLCELKTSKDLFVSFIFCLCCCKMLQLSVFIYLILFVVVLFLE